MPQPQSSGVGVIRMLLLPSLAVVASSDAVEVWPFCQVSQVSSEDGSASLAST